MGGGAYTDGLLKRPWVYTLEVKWLITFFEFFDIHVHVV